MVYMNWFPQKMAEFGKVSSAVNRDQDDIDLEQVSL